MNLSKAITKAGLTINLFIISGLLIFSSCSTNYKDSNIERTPGKQQESKVTLTFWDMMWGVGDYQESVKKLLQKYMKKDEGIEVIYQAIPWDNYLQIFNTAVAANAAPDVATGGGSTQHLFAKAGLILELDSIVDEWRQEGQIDDFYPGLIDSFKYEGRQVGIPWGCDARLIWYRTDLFSLAGIQHLPRNQVEFYEVAKKLKRAGFTPLVIDLNHHSYPINFYAMLSGNNGGGIVINNNEITVDNQGNLETMRYLKKWADEGLISQNSVAYVEQAHLEFLKGNAAMVYHNMNIASLARNQAPDIADMLGILPNFAGSAGKDTAVFAFNAVFSFNQTKYPAKAKDFIKWWSENQLTLFTEGNASLLPVRKSFNNAAFFEKDKYKKYVIDNLIQYAANQCYPNKETFPELQIILSDKIISQALQKLFLTNDSEERILAYAKDSIKQIFGKPDN